MTLPLYGNESIANLMASLVQGLGGSATGYVPLPHLLPAEVAEYRHVVLMVVDGLGCEFLCRKRRRSSLEGLCRARLTSVFPSTTAAAITTFLSGVAPQQHGLSGWHMYFRELGAVLAVLPGAPRYGGVSLKQAGVDVSRLLGSCSVFDRVPAETHTVLPRRLAATDFNLAYQGTSQVRPYDTQDDFFLGVAKLLRTGRDRSFVYAYWPDLDRISHECGTFSAETEWHFTSWEEGFRRFLKYVEGTGSLILVTADHGFIDTEAAHTIELDDHPELARCLALPLCGEHRVAYCYVKPDCREPFERYVRTELADAAELHRSADLIEQGWFGLGTAHPRLAERVGDYTLVMRDNYIIRDWLPDEPRFEQIGVHGGISEAEMRVPLIVATA
jgi:hypothetical protein